LTFAYNVEHSAHASAVVDRIATYLDTLTFTDEQRCLLPACDRLNRRRAEARSVRPRNRLNR
jgi:hypothetical protein